MNPVMVFNGDGPASMGKAAGDGSLMLVCGTPGADTQVQTNMQVITHLIDFGMTVAEAVEAPIWLHPDDGMLWDVVYPDRRVDDSLRDGASIAVGGEDLTIMHTPGHSPGGCCIHVPSLGLVFSGDTLFNGGPGATGRSFSSHDVLVGSIRSRLFALPDETVVHTGHGDSTTIGREARNLDGLTDGVDRDPGSPDAAS